MSAKARSSLALIVGLVVGIMTFHLRAGPAYAGEKVLSLKGHEVGSFLVRVKEEGLLPIQTTVKPGTTMIWLNMQSRFIEIGFTGDQKVDIACRAPVHFVLGVDMSYISDKIPYGAVASLCFIEKGTYRYTMRSSASFSTFGERPAETTQGTIIVKD
tara:strand:+ start:101 stop:571 length:471 start_codon:yes stop_codon:yes gene_type:complete